ncbi:MAG: tetratricopeptide repeat protein [Myxococcota bacterium]|nr:tetratricopeptide repeat protein [Myxococcota bacterium]
MKRSDCLSDLVTRARRYRLSQAEQVHLEEHLAVCASCRLQQQITADFDMMAGPRPGDDVLIAHLAERAMDTPRRKIASHARRRSVGIAAATACVLFAAAAVAGALSQRRAHALIEAPAPVSARPMCEHPERADCAAPRVIVAGSQIAVTTPQEDEKATARSAPMRPARNLHAAFAAPASPKVEPAAALDENASSLFSRANGERRHNHVAAAISLYGELQRRYSGSEEAAISHVSLGRLLLDRGIWSEGLSQLEDYLANSPEGLLVPEALFGKARALEALGRRDDERSTWNRLLTKFGDSVYAPQARHRLQDLQ